VAMMLLIKTVQLLIVLHLAEWKLPLALGFLNAKEASINIPVVKLRKRFERFMTISFLGSKTRKALSRNGAMICINAPFVRSACYYWARDLSFVIHRSWVRQVPI